MRSLGLSSLLVVPLMLAACGGDDGGADVDAGPPGPLNCNGEDLPTTAIDPITVNGIANEATASGSEPLEGVVVEAFENGSTTVQATGNTGADGGYTLSIVTGGTPVDGYIRGRLPGMAEFRDVYLYPPAPLSADTADAPLLFVSDSTFGLIDVLTGESQEDGNGWMGVLVVDCFNEPVAGATVVTTPPYTVKYNEEGLPNPDPVVTDVDGIVYVFNIAAGQVTVDATLDGQSFREHVVEVRADVVTTTAVAPGPQWPTP